MSERLMELRQLMPVIYAEICAELNAQQRRALSSDRLAASRWITDKAVFRLLDEKRIDFIHGSARAIELALADDDLERAVAIAFTREERREVATILGGVNVSVYLDALVDDAHPNQPQLSRRTRRATDLALRLLSPEHRQRYREEWSAELADLPRSDQAPYAFRLLFRAWSLRQSLKGKSGVGSAGALTLVVAGGGSIACQIVIGWPAAVLGGAAIFAVMWTIGSADRTDRLASLIRSARGGPASKQKK
jgi:hypothetical protein